MAKSDMEDFDFLDNLLSGSEDDLKEGDDKKPSENVSPGNKQNIQDKLLQEMEDEFSTVEDEFLNSNQQKKENKIPDNVKSSNRNEKSKDPFSSMLEDELHVFEEESPIASKQKTSNDNKKTEVKLDKKIESSKSAKPIKEEKKDDFITTVAREDEIIEKIQDKNEDGEFVNIYDDEELEDVDNDFHNDDEDEYAGLSPTIRAALEWEPPLPKSTPELLVNEWIQTGWVGNLHIDQILTEAILTGASDVHITADLKVSMTRNGDIIRYDGYAIPDEETMHEIVHNGILTHQQQSVFNRDYEYEGSYTLMYGPFTGRRTRLTMGKTFGKYFMVFRIISEYIPSLEDLKVEDEIVRWSHYPNGLFLLCGPTGSGKSTTLASVLHNLQMTTRKKIISIEKPIEYVYPDNAPSLVVQRDVGEDTRGFYEGLTSAMRQSPNVILLGEVRNTEEVSELLRAAETGHLAISTMHTNSVATTINRIQNLFEGNEQRRIMSTLADTMRGIGNQVLVKTKDGQSRFAVRELLTINDEIKELIIAGDVQGIRRYQERNEATMEHKLAKAVQEGRCHYEDALGQTADPILFNKLLGKQ